MRVEVIGCLSIADRPLIIKNLITPEPPIRRCSERRFSREALYYMCKTLLKNTYAAIVALFIAMMALPTTAQAQKSKMSMRLCGKYYSADATIPLGGGTAKWNQATTTLTLNNVKVENLNTSFLWCNNIPNLKIVLVGKNIVSTTMYILYWGNGNVEISGRGSLTARTKDNIAITNESASTLTIKDCTLDVQGKNYSIVGFYNGSGTECLSLVVDNATVKVKGNTGGWGWKKSGIGCLKAYELRNCYISTPGVKFGKTYAHNYYEFVGRDGDTYYGEVTIKPATTYDLWLAGTQVCSGNCADLSTIPGISGKASYDPGTKTLTLQNAKLNAEGYDNCIWSYIDDLTIKVSGTNELNAIKRSAIIALKPMTLTGGGTLNAKSEEYVTIYAGRTNLTIKDCIVNAKGNWGITGDEGSNGELRISNATVTAEGRDGSICDFKAITLAGCAITRPVGAKFDTSQKAVVLNGEIVKSEVKIEPITKYDLEICGTWVTSGNCGDLSAIDGVEGTVSYDPDNKTLTLEDAKLNAKGEFDCIESRIDGLTIKVSGTNELNIGDWTAITVYAPTTITGGGTLNVKSKYAAIYVWRTNLTIKDCIVNAKGYWGIVGREGSNEKLLISKATVTAEGRAGSIYDFKEITLEDCAITRPVGAKFDTSQGAIVLNGRVVTSGVKIEPIIRYDLWIANTQVTSINCDDLSTIPGILSGKASYDPETTTLTFDNVKAEKQNADFLRCYNIPNLKIVLVGKNIANTKGHTLYWGNGNVEISGTGSLTARSGSYTAIANDDKPSTLTIKDCTLDVRGNDYSIVGYHNGDNTESLTLVVDNATVKVKGATGGWGWKTSGIDGLKAYELRNCYISTPGVKFGKVYKNTYYELVGTDGDTYYGEVTIKPATTYNLWIAGTQVSSGNCADLSTIPGISGKVSYDPGTKTLTLDNAIINTTAEGNNGIGIKNGISGLTLRLIGENTITAEKSGGIRNGQAAALNIIGEGKLTVNGSTTASYEYYRFGFINYGTVTVSNCALEVVGGRCGLSWGLWKFDHCNIRAKGSGSVDGPSDGSLCDMSDYPEFIGCTITSPTGTYWKKYDTNGAYSLFGADDKVVTDWVTIAAPTGINTPTIDTAAKQGIYTLSGVKLSGEMKDLPKGVYIVNGKKVVK